MYIVKYNIIYVINILWTFYKHVINILLKQMFYLQYCIYIYIT